MKLTMFVLWSTQANLAGLFSVVLWLALPCFGGSVQGSEPERPNVRLALVDDQGFGDLGVHDAVLHNNGQGTAYNYATGCTNNWITNETSTDAYLEWISGVKTEEICRVMVRFSLREGTHQVDGCLFAKEVGKGTSSIKTLERRCTNCRFFTPPRR